MKHLYLKYRFIILLIFTGSGPALSAEGQVAYVLGDIVKIPVLSVGVSAYSLDLQLLPNTDPVQLIMVSALDITASEPNLSEASSFANNTLTIPSLTAGNASYRVALLLVSVEPSVVLQLSKVDLLPVPSSPSPTQQQAPVKAYLAKAQELFSSSIAQSIIQTKCVSCHRQGGYAGGTSLIFVRAGETSQGTNIAAFEAQLKRRADGVNYILRKVSGNGHGGGRQLVVGSASYNNLTEFLTLLSRSGSSDSSQ